MLLYLASLSSSSSRQVISRPNSRYFTRRFRTSSTSKQADSSWLRDGGKDLDKNPSLSSVHPSRRAHHCRQKFIVVAQSPSNSSNQQRHHTPRNPFDPFPRQAISRIPHSAVVPFLGLLSRGHGGPSVSDAFPAFWVLAGWPRRVEGF